MKKAIIGSGGFGREVRALILDNNPNEIVDFFVDDDYVDDISIPLSKLDIESYEVLIAIGDPILREKIYNKMPKNTKYFTIIHKSAIILDKNIEIGEGSVICANSILTTNIKIGRHSHLNLQTTIGHDVVIGDFFTTAPGSKVSGNCKIGKSVYIGTNSSIKEKIDICSNVTIGLNSGVVKNINEPGVYVGTPVKKLIK
jgi:sugar O-acyltransferase (sialic acid O-acetyltransferase NeuD family)